MILAKVSPSFKAALHAKAKATVEASLSALPVPTGHPSKPTNTGEWPNVSKLASKTCEGGSQAQSRN